MEPEKQRVYHAATYNNFTDIFIFYGALHNNNLLIYSISFDVATYLRDQGNSIDDERVYPRTPSIKL